MKKFSELKSEARESLKGNWGKAFGIYFSYLIISYLITSFLTKYFPTIVLPYYVINVPITFGIIFALYKLFNNESVGLFDYFSLAFKNFERSWKVLGNTILKVIVPLILCITFLLPFIINISYNVLVYIINGNVNFNFLISVIIYGILALIFGIWYFVKSLYYSLGNIIAIDNPDISAEEAVLKSKELMTGKRAELFGLQLSFIGWYLLLGIAITIVTNYCTFVGASDLIQKTVYYAVYYIGISLLMPYVQFSTFAFYKNLKEEKQIVDENSTPTNENENPISEE